MSAEFYTAFMPAGKKMKNIFHFMGNVIKLSVMLSGLGRSKKKKDFYRFVICTNIISKHLKCVYKVSRHSVKEFYSFRGVQISKFVKKLKFSK